MLKRVKEHLMPKKSKNRKEMIKEQEQDQENLDLSISDCTCPICLEILIEPVNVPCKHEVCKKCFETMLDQTNLCCPMCRIRLSTWPRNARSTNTLVNADRWNTLQKMFSKEIKNRLEGKTNQDLIESMSKIKAEQPKCVQNGEIGKEYQEMLRREQERLRIEKENEEQLSLAFIQQVLQQEGNTQELNGLIKRQRTSGTNILTPNQNIVNNSNNNNNNVQPVTVEPVIDLPPPPPVPPLLIDNDQPSTSNGNTTLKRKRTIKHTPDEEFTRVTRSISLRLTARPDFLNATTTSTNEQRKATKRANQTLDTSTTLDVTANTSTTVKSHKIKKTRN